MGNNRVVADAHGEVVQRNDYYPFGMPFGRNHNAGVQPFKFVGKEFDTMNGIDKYDQHARQYNPVLLTFDSVDPLAEKYYSWSPYVYCANNPLKYIDPNGMDYTLFGEAAQEAWRQFQQAYRMTANSLLHSLGMHPDQLNSDDPKVLEKAKKKRENADLTLRQIGNEMLYMIPVVGSGKEAYDKGSQGDYTGAAFAAIWVVVDAVSLGEGKIANTFFKGAKYSAKVTQQINKANDLKHAFPSAIDGYAATYGKTRKITGGDGKVYEILEIKGNINGKSGTFEYIKDANGEINHRFFNTKK